MSKDLIFLSGQYENFELPKEKKFLLKYCETPVQKAFLQYYHAFGNYDHFCDHTGFVIQKRWMKMLLGKLQKLENILVEARKNFDLELVSRIESGKYKIRA